MVLHHVTVPRQLTGGPLLCVRGVTCHMIDGTTGVQGLRLIASLNHFVWRSADGLPAARAPACPRTQDTCIQTQMLERQTQTQTHTDDRENNSGSKLQFRFTCRKSRSSRQRSKNRRDVVAVLELFRGRKCSSSLPLIKLSVVTKTNK